MAKKKDITRNPPSIFEIAIFIVMILIMAFIAWQLVSIIGSSSKNLETCLHFQDTAKANIEKWRTDNNKSETDFPTADELAAYFNSNTIPMCPDSTADNPIHIYNEAFGLVKCPNHAKVDVGTTPTPTATPAA